MSGSEIFLLTCCIILLILCGLANFMWGRTIKCNKETLVGWKNAEKDWLEIINDVGNALGEISTILRRCNVDSNVEKTILEIGTELSSIKCENIKNLAKALSLVKKESS